MMASLSPSLQQVAWSDCVFCTENFLRTVKQNSDCQKLDDYLRPVDGMLVLQVPSLFATVWLPNSVASVLLLSQREVDRILSLMWSLGPPSWVSLTNLCYARLACDTNAPPKLQISSSASRVQEMQNKTVASLQLFSGEATFGDERCTERALARRTALKDMLKRDAAKYAAVVLVQMRGQLHVMAHSDLEKVCGSAVREARESEEINLGKFQEEHELQVALAHSEGGSWGAR